VVDQIAGGLVSPSSLGVGGAGLAALVLLALLLLRKKKPPPEESGAGATMIDLSSFRDAPDLFLSEYGLSGEGRALSEDGEEGGPHEPPAPFGLSGDHFNGSEHNPDDFGPDFSEA
jgi:hypothetical protein